MKKLLAVSIILCLAFSAFAAVTVRVGGAFDFIYGKNAENAEESIQEYYYKAHGFGFEVSGTYDINGKISGWDNVSLVFPSTIKQSDDGESWASLADDSATKYFMSAASGVAFKIDLNAPVDLKAGFGLLYDRLFVSAKTGSNAENKIAFNNFGIALYADASYKFNENFSAGLTVMPSLGVYNIVTMKMYANDQEIASHDANGFKLSFSMPVNIGVTYNF